MTGDQILAGVASLKGGAPTGITLEQFNAARAAIKQCPHFRYVVVLSQRQADQGGVKDGDISDGCLIRVVGKFTPFGGGTIDSIWIDEDGKRD